MLSPAGVKETALCLCFHAHIVLFQCTVGVCHVLSKREPLQYFSVEVVQSHQQCFMCKTRVRTKLTSPPQTEAKSWLIFFFFFFSDQKSKAKVRIRWTMFCAYLLSMTSLHHPRKKNDKLGWDWGKPKIPQEEPKSSCELKIRGFF